MVVITGFFQKWEGEGGYCMHVCVLHFRVARLIDWGLDVWYSIMQFDSTHTRALHYVDDVIDKPRRSKSFSFDTATYPIAQIYTY